VSETESIRVSHLTRDDFTAILNLLIDYYYHPHSILFSVFHLIFV